MAGPQRIRDMYDQLPHQRGVELRRQNLERLAALEADGADRRSRLAALFGEPPREG